jgi:uncharacterized membrane protein YgaE (UPF0421/DUF939 family)
VGIDKEKTIRTWRLALTCIFLFLISWHYEIPESSWALVTIWFVMYEYSTVGGVLNKGLLRFLGTVLSALYGIIIIYFGGNNPLINLLALIPGLFIYTYFFMGNDKSYTGTIGAVTLTIVLLNYNNIDVAIVRVFNVILGIVASIVMIRFFYPQYARNLVIENQILWLNQLTALLQSYLDLCQEHGTVKNKSYDLEHSMLTNSPTYTRLVNEAKMETKQAPFFSVHSVAIKEQFQLLFRLFSMFFSLLSNPNTRIHPWVIEQLTRMLYRVHQLKSLLFCVDEPREIAPHLVAHQPTAEATEGVALILDHKLSIEDLFQEINTTIDLLEQHVEQIVLVYKHYDCMIQPSLRI